MDKPQINVASDLYERVRSISWRNNVSARSVFSRAIMRALDDAQAAQRRYYSVSITPDLRRRLLAIQGPNETQAALVARVIERGLEAM